MRGLQTQLVRVFFVGISLRFSLFFDRSFLAHVMLMLVLAYYTLTLHFYGLMIHFTSLSTPKNFHIKTEQDSRLLWKIFLMELL